MESLEDEKLTQVVQLSAPRILLKYKSIKAKLFIDF
jgi:hypothetical protein